MAHAGSPPGLQPFLPTDAPLLAALFRESVETLAADDYDEDQRAAWASVADDEDAFAKRLAGNLTIVGLLDGAIAGFATLREGKLFDLLYVHPRAARRGVGSALADGIEKLAAARGASEIVVDASDAARDFFAARGYVAFQRNMVELRGEWLGNTTMKKTFEKKAS
ncbi:MAG: GNAT family N-acetyltransferase [Methylocystaceae bacterium]|nr:MAG: GNAT family N-acetyltransferase [Methylocystaceae bacterium]